MTRIYAYKHALRVGIVDLDAERTRAIQECYLKAVAEGYYPVAKPTVELDTGDPGFRTYAPYGPTLRVTVKCLP